MRARKNNWLLFFRSETTQSKELAEPSFSERSSREAITNDYATVAEYNSPLLRGEPIRKDRPKHYRDRLKHHNDFVS